MSLIFKTDFFGEDFECLLDNLDEQWNPFELKFEILCKILAIKRQKNVFIIDGSIAAGKTTLLNNIVKQSKQPKINIVSEPIDIWQSVGIIDKNGEFTNSLKLFYLARNTTNGNRYHIFLFQIIVLLSQVLLMIQKLTEHCDENEIVVFERHPKSDKIFFELSKNLVDEHLVEKYERLIQTVDSCVPLFKWIFVGMSMDPLDYRRCICQHVSNMQKRNRNEEATVPYDYMEALFLRYVDFISNDLNNINKWVLDYGKNEQDMCDRALQILYNAV